MEGEYLKYPSLQSDDETVIQSLITGEIPQVFTETGGFRRLKDNLVSESSRLALSSQVWRNVVPTIDCDVLITLPKNHTYAKEIVTWIVHKIKLKEPKLKMQVRYHAQINSYGLYITARYDSILRGVEMVHLKKRVKDIYGGGLREFVYEDMEMFANVKNKARFVTSEDRAFIIRYFIENIRADDFDDPLKVEDNTILYTFRNGQAIIAALLSCGLLQNMQMLHEKEMQHRLQKSWVQSPLAYQPLQDITNYFGVQLGLYFAWLGHYTTALFLPACLGFIMFWWGGTIADDDKRSLTTDILFVVFCLFNCIWGTLYIESWKRKQAEWAYKWGTLGLEKELLTEPRPMFRGDISRSAVTGRLEPVYPVWKRNFTRYIISLPVTLCAMAIMFFLMLAIFELQETCNYHFGESYLFSWVPLLPKILLAVVISISDDCYDKVAVFLNDLENYRTDDEYENHLILKILSFQFVNSFLALFYIAFYLKDMQRLKVQLAAFLITKQVMGNMSEAVIPFVKEKLQLLKMSYHMTKSMSHHSLEVHAHNCKTLQFPVVDRDDLSPRSELSENVAFFESDSENAGLRLRKVTSDNSSSPEKKDTAGDLFRKTSQLPLPEFKPTGPRITQAELESLLPIYESPLCDYLEMVIQFGYVLLFSPAFPLAALCALINNLLEIRVDAFKLCYAYQRPFGRRVEDIGSWMMALEIMGMLGVLVNCALIGQSGLVQRLYPDLSLAGHILLVVVLEHVMLVIKLVIAHAIPDVPDWVTVQMAKIEHARREALKRESRRERNSMSTSEETKIYSPTKSNRTRSETRGIRPNVTSV